MIRGWTARLLGGATGLVYLFLYAPVLLLVVYSFSADRNVGRWGGFTLDWYREFGANENVQNLSLIHI